MSRKPLGPSSVQAEPPLAPDSVPLTRYPGAVRRHLTALVIALVLGVGCGVAKIVLTPPTYTASVAVLAPPVTLHPGFGAGRGLTAGSRTPRDTTMDTEAQLVWSDEVMRRLATFPGFQMPRERLRERIMLTVPANTHVLTIQVRAPSAEIAVSGAEAVAEAYLNLRQQIMGSVQQRNRESLQRNVSLLNKQLEALPGDDSQLTRLTARTRRQALMKRIQAVEKQISGLDSKAVQPGEVLRGAQRPASRDDLGFDVALASGAGLGLLGWLGWVLVLAARPRRIRRPADVRLHSRLPIMVESPAYDGGHREVCRRLRNLVFDAEADRVLVTGVPARAGTAIAYELAQLCAEGGSPTTVLRVHDGSAPPETSTTGDVPARAFQVRFIRSDDDRQLARGIARAARESRIVVITTPDLTAADTTSAAVASDLTIVVVERGSALDRDVARGVLALDQAATPARGIVLTAQASG
ncbi:hypothetical protein [Actinomadura flavalba]|uniref:hypothetical protein n=1 Tax=Actinomadura flavalba TaxID=1120938 RepID=UPI000399E647|nr:hypothetical protein [Actinomadura flavalba]